jgi:hypothetical protein
MTVTSLEDVMNELKHLNLVIMYIKELPYPFLGNGTCKSRDSKIIKEIVKLNLV